jgi:carotenoid cleavage dioxygenase-like enzyme
VAPRVGGTEEDDAYLVTLTVDMNRDASECVVFRAADVASGPIARARLPERIASGTHACWAPGESVKGWLSGSRRTGDEQQRLRTPRPPSPY